MGRSELTGGHQGRRLSGARRRARRSLAAAGLAGCALAAAGGASAAELVLDADATRISFSLDATLHSVEGTARLREGVVHFDPMGGGASGRIAIPAASAETGIDSRDEKMRAEVLKSGEHPEIVFQVSELRVESRRPDEAELRLSGTLELAGVRHALEIPAHVRRLGPERVAIESAFAIPYVAWGLEDVSNFLLRVGKEVRVEVRAEARLEGVP